MAIVIDGKEYNQQAIADGIEANGEVVVDGMRFFRNGRRIACEKVEPDVEDE